MSEGPVLLVVPAFVRPRSIANAAEVAVDLRDHGVEIRGYTLPGALRGFRDWDYYGDLSDQSRAAEAYANQLKGMARAVTGLLVVNSENQPIPGNPRSWLGAVGNPIVDVMTHFASHDRKVILWKRQQAKDVHVSELPEEMQDKIARLRLLRPPKLRLANENHQKVKEILGER